LKPFSKKLVASRKAQIKRIKNHEIGTRNSQFFLSYLGEFRNLALFTIRLVKIYEELIDASQLESSDETEGSDVMDEEQVKDTISPMPDEPVEIADAPPEVAEEPVDVAEEPVEIVEDAPDEEPEQTDD
jgi:hypothetical protein